MDGCDQVERAERSAAEPYNATGTNASLCRMSALEGDITEFGGDAIVNAANESLLGGGGVDYAIHKKAGPKLVEECKRIAVISKGGQQTASGPPIRCETGDARITLGHALPTRFVIHTPRPIWYGGQQNEEGLLEKSYTSSLQLAASHKLDSIAFPAISTGVYGFPLHKATGVAVRAVDSWLRASDYPKHVYFYCFSRCDFNAYSQELDELSMRSRLCTGPGELVSDQETKTGGSATLANADSRGNRVHKTGSTNNPGGCIIDDEKLYRPSESNIRSVTQNQQIQFCRDATQKEPDEPVPLTYRSELTALFHEDIVRGQKAETSNCTHARRMTMKDEVDTVALGTKGTLTRGADAVNDNTHN